MGELEAIGGSGKDGRVTKKDILAYVKTRSSQPAKVAVSSFKRSIKTCSRTSSSGNASKHFW